MNVLSVFDGIGTGRLALENAGISIEKYYSSEIEPAAITVQRANWTDFIELGDIREIKAKELDRIDLMIGGSPCQGFSRQGKGLNFKDERSKLFFEFARILQEHRRGDTASKGKYNTCGYRGRKNYRRVGSTEEITWTRFVQLVNDLYPVTEAEPEEQIEGQQDLDEYPEVTGGVSIKKDTAHFKIDGVLNQDYTPMGLPYSCYITAILHSGIFSQDFIESYKGSRGINALLNIIENYRKKLCYDEGKYAPGKKSYDFKHEGKEYAAYFDNRGFNVDSKDNQYREYLRDYDLLELLEAMLEAGYFGVVETLKNTIKRTVKKVSEHDTGRQQDKTENTGAINESETGEQEEDQAAAVEEELDIAEATGILTADLFQLREFINEDDFYTLQEIVINCELAARHLHEVKE